MGRVFLKNLIYAGLLIVGATIGMGFVILPLVFGLKGLIPLSLAIVIAFVALVVMIAVLATLDHYGKLTPKV